MDGCNYYYQTHFGAPYLLGPIHSNNVDLTVIPWWIIVTFLSCMLPTEACIGHCLYVFAIANTDRSRNPWTKHATHALGSSSNIQLTELFPTKWTRYVISIEVSEKQWLGLIIKCCCGSLGTPNRW